MHSTALSCDALQPRFLPYPRQALAQGVPGLRCISLRRCEGLASVAALARLTRLEDLDLSYCAHADAAAVGAAHPSLLWMGHFGPCLLRTSPAACNWPPFVSIVW